MLKTSVNPVTPHWGWIEDVFKESQIRLLLPIGCCSCVVCCTFLSFFYFFIFRLKFSVPSAHFSIVLTFLSGRATRGLHRQLCTWQILRCLTVGFTVGTLGFRCFWIMVVEVPQHTSVLGEFVWNISTKGWKQGLWKVWKHTDSNVFTV